MRVCASPTFHPIRGIEQTIFGPYSIPQAPFNPYFVQFFAHIYGLHAFRIWFRSILPGVREASYPLRHAVNNNSAFSKLLVINNGWRCVLYIFFLCLRGGQHRPHHCRPLSVLCLCACVCARLRAQNNTARMKIIIASSWVPHEIREIQNK